MSTGTHNGIVVKVPQIRALCVIAVRSTPQQLRSILETRLSEDNRRFEAMLRTLVAWREERESSTRELLERLG